MQKSGGFYILLKVWHNYLISGCTVSFGHLVEVSCIIHRIIICQLRWLFLLLVNIYFICMLMSKTHHVMAYPVWVGVMWRVISPLWHMPSAILSLSTSPRFPAVGPVALSDVRSRKHDCTPRTQASTLTKTHTHTYTYRFAAIRVMLWAYCLPRFYPIRSFCRWRKQILPFL